MGFLTVPTLTWSAFYELYHNLTWGTHAYGWTLVEEQVEKVEKDGHSVMLAILLKDQPPSWSKPVEPVRWGAWFEWHPVWGLGVNNMFDEAVPADTMMQVVPIRPVPATRWEVVA